MIPQQNVHRVEPVMPTMPRTPVIGMNVQTFPCWVDLQEIRKRTNSNSKRQMPYKTDTSGDTNHYGIAVGYPVFVVNPKGKLGGRVCGLQTLNGLVLDEKIRNEFDLLSKTRFLGIAHTSNRVKKLRNSFQPRPTTFDVAYFGKVTLINHTFTPPVRDTDLKLLKGSCRGVSVNSGDKLTIGFFPFNLDQDEKHELIGCDNVDPTKEDYYKFWYKNVDAKTERIVPVWYKHDEYIPLYREYLRNVLLYDIVAVGQYNGAFTEKYKYIFPDEVKIPELVKDVVKNQASEKLPELAKRIIDKHGKCDILSRRVHFKVLGGTDGKTEVKFGKEMVGVITMCDSN